MFTRYYDKNHWGDSESRSGPGSRTDSPSVGHAIRILSEVAAKYDIRNIADIPCGDFNWIGTFLQSHPELGYIGFDIVAKLIECNRRRFPSREFARLDVVASIPPKVDLIFCKDLINHLEYREIIQAITNMRQSGSTYLLATNNFGYKNTGLIRMRHISSRHVDLTLAPFNYTVPIWHDHYLALWRLPEMERRK